MKNKLMIAAAGAGKTYTLINKAMDTDKKTLITTFTIDNAKNIKKSFFETVGYIPENVIIQTWFSLLLQHGVKPFLRSALGDQTFRLNGLQLVNRASARYEKTMLDNGYFNKAHFFTKDNRIYSDKISKFVFKNNSLTNNAIINRLEKIYSNVFIDETQDLAGYDLELIHLLLKSNIKVMMVGDNRQVTYHTHFSMKNKKYNNGKIEQYLLEKCNEELYQVDKETLKDSYRCCQEICDFSNTIFPNESEANSKRKELVENQGIYFVRSKDIASFLKEYKPMQLRHNRSRKVDPNYTVKNFGESKGDTVDNVLIYPTQPIKKWILNGTNMKFETQSKFYVAVTRAKYRVGIVWDEKEIPTIGHLYDTEYLVNNQGGENGKY